jgi:hypothetical protein
MAQERQLESTRRLEQRQLLIGQVRQELLALLESIKLQEAARTLSGEVEEAQDRRPEVVFVGALVDGRLRLPWEVSPATRAFRAALADTTTRCDTTGRRGRSRGSGPSNSTPGC